MTQAYHLPASASPGGLRRKAPATASVHEAGDDVAVGAPDLHLAAALQHQKAFAVGVGLHLPHLVEVDDAGAVDALEAARVEALLEVLHRLAEDQSVVAGVDAHIVAGRVDLLDRIDVDAEDLAAVLDVDELLVAVGGMGVVAARRRLDALHRLGRDFGEHLLEGRDLLDPALL